MFTYRPWGNVHWLLEKLGCDDWAALGCVATEKRSCSSIANFHEWCSSAYLVKIVDTQPRDMAKAEKAYETSLKELSDVPGGKLSIVEADLVAPLDTLEQYLDVCAVKSKNLILDITSFPKRWFFPLLSKACRDERFQEIVVVYTQGQGYAKNIAENPEVLRALPGFPADYDRDSHDHIFVGVGFHDLGMIKLLGEDNGEKLNLLFPFPPGPPGNRKNWKFVEQINRKLKSDETTGALSNSLDLHFLPAIDASRAFDALAEITLGGEMTSIMAPYGPKPISLAMCLFAIAAEKKNLPKIPVYYSQPRRYAIDYTSKPSFTNDVMDVWGYSIKSGGEMRYAL